MKPIIGILSPYKEVKDYPYDTVYKTVDLYVKKIESINCIPISLIDVENNQDILNICDAFLLPGGNKIIKDHYYIIQHCIKKNKPLLGICLGMQAMILYDLLSHQYPTITNLDELYSMYKEFNEKETIFHEVNKSIHGGDLCIGELDPTIDNILKSTHNINILPNTLLMDIYQSNVKNVISMHTYGVQNNHLQIFKVSSFSEDKIIESIEYNNKDYFILGFQYHIEIEDNQIIFKRLKEEIEKRR